MKKILLTLLLTTLTTGCGGKVLEDFVGGATPAPPGGSTETPTGPAGPASVRISPGYMKATSGGVGLEASITPTEQIISGGGISAKITMGRSRTQ
jgi:hypothetical protein